MANPEMGLLSKIVRHDALKHAIEWGLRDDDFLTDEGRAIYQHMLMMIRDPRFNGSTPGVNVMATLYPNFELCDDHSMSLEAYCTMVRENKLSVELQGAFREALASPDNAVDRATKLMDRLNRNVVSVGLTKATTRRSAAMFAVQPSDAELRSQQLIPQLRIGPGAPTLLVAPGYAGKTALAQQMGLAIASGEKVWDLFEGRRGRVLHADGEQGRHATEQRYRQLARGMEIDLATLDEHLVVEYAPPPLVAVEGRARPAPNEYQWLHLAHGYELVIIDNLAALSPGLQENSSEIRMVLDMLRRVSESTGATFVVLHHTTKPSKGGARGRATIRGSGAIFDAASAALMLERDDAQFDSVRVVCEKARGGLEVGAIPSFRVSKQPVGRDGFREVATWEASGTSSRGLKCDDAEERILHALERAGGVVTTREALRKLTKLGSTPLREGLARLQAQGRVAVAHGEIRLVKLSQTTTTSAPPAKPKLKPPHRWPGLRVAKA